MSNKTVIENKITAVQKYLKILSKYDNYSAAEIIKNDERRGSLERYLYLAVQATINLAESIIAYKKYRKPTSMSEVFEILQEEKLITKKLREKMINMTGFRNILAHDYEKIDYNIVYSILRSGPEDIKKFLQITKRLFKN